MKTKLLLPIVLFSMGALAQNRLEIVNNFLKTTALSKKIISSPIDYNVLNDHELINGAEYVKIQQKFNGIPIYQAFGTFSIKNGKVVSFNNNFIDLSKGKSLLTSPNLKASEAIATFAKNSGKNLILIKSIDEIKQNTQLKQKPTGNDVVFIEDSPTHLIYYNDSNQLKLAWLLLAEIKNSKKSGESDHQNSTYEAIIDANTGDLLSKTSIMSSCTFQPDFQNNNVYKNNTQDFEWVAREYQAPLFTVNGSYNVVPANFNSPLDHNYTLLTNVADPEASVEGWHKVLSYATTPGITDNYTIGNNSHVGYDENGEFKDLISGPFGNLMLLLNKQYIKKETKGNNYVFDFPNPGTSTNYDPLAYTDLVNTQMFYSTNFIHDILYYHGFNPAAGSFQANTGEGYNLIAFTTSGLGQQKALNNAEMGYSNIIKNPTTLFYTFETPNDAGVLQIPTGLLTGKYPGGIGNNNFPYSTSNVTDNLILYNDGTGGDPNDGCEAAINPSEFSGKIIAVNRGNCNFATKVNNIKDFNPKGIVILNHLPTALPPNIDIANPNLMIPVVGVNKEIGDKIRNTLVNNQAITATLPAEGFAITRRNGGLDSQIILHEYTHAVSKRLMNDAQSGEEQMGEGWSDYFAINITQKTSQVSTDQINMGSYAFGGGGLRVLPYTTDMSVNPHTYDYLKVIGSGDNLMHPTGYLWSLMLWEMHWALVNKYGFNPDIKGSTGGNNISLNLVIQGMKMGVPNPGFVDGRNAILQADDALYSGQNKCDIWKAFAKRGLGYSAIQGTSASRTDGTEAFDMPPADVLNCSQLAVSESVKNELSIFPNPAKDVVYINTTDKVKKAEFIDMVGRIVSTQILQQEKNKTQVDTSGLSKGIYILKIYTEKGEITKKVMKN